MSAAYVGNTVRHLAVYFNSNSPQQILPPGLNSYSYAAYPDFPGFTETSFGGNSFYNGLQLNYERRLRAGLSILANFTWSKCRPTPPTC